MIIKIKTYSGETLYLPEEDYLSEIMFSDEEDLELQKKKEDKKNKLRGAGAAFLTGAGTGAALSGLSYLTGIHGKKIADKITDPDRITRADRINRKIAKLVNLREEVKGSLLGDKVKEARINKLELKRLGLVKKLGEAELKDEKSQKIRENIAERLRKCGEHFDKFNNKERKMANVVGLTAAVGGTAAALYGGKKLLDYRKKKQQERRIQNANKNQNL